MNCGRNSTGRFTVGTAVALLPLLLALSGKSRAEPGGSQICYCQPIVTPINNGCGCTLRFSVTAHEGVCTPPPDCNQESGCSVNGWIGWKCPGVPLFATPFGLSADCKNSTVSATIDCPQGGGTGEIRLFCSVCQEGGS